MKSNGTHVFPADSAVLKDRSYSPHQGEGVSGFVILSVSKGV